MTNNRHHPRRAAIRNDCRARQPRNIRITLLVIPTGTKDRVKTGGNIGQLSSRGDQRGPSSFTPRLEIVKGSETNIKGTPGYL